MVLQVLNSHSTLSSGVGRTVSRTVSVAGNGAKVVLGVTLGCNKHDRVIHTTRVTTATISDKRVSPRSVARSCLRNYVCATSYPPISLVVHPDKRRHLSGFLL